MTSFEDLVLKIIDLTKNRVVITKTHDNTALAVMLPIKEFYQMESRNARFPCMVVNLIGWRSEM